MVGAWLVGLGTAWAALGPPITATGDTGFGTDSPTTVETGYFETGGTDSGTPTAGDTNDTGSRPCPECMGAAELAGDPGGAPCDEGCSTSHGLGPGFAGLLLVLGARRRAAVQSRRQG